MDLRLWIKENGGDAIIAKKLGVSRYRVRHWRMGDARPSAAMAYKLYKLGNGALTLGEATGLSESRAYSMIKHRPTLYNKVQS